MIVKQTFNFKFLKPSTNDFHRINFNGIYFLILVEASPINTSKALLI